MTASSGYSEACRISPIGCISLQLLVRSIVAVALLRPFLKPIANVPHAKARTLQYLQTSPSNQNHGHGLLSGVRRSCIRSRRKLNWGLCFLTLSEKRHLKYTIPPALLLTLLFRPLCSRLDIYKIVFLVTVRPTHRHDVIHQEPPIGPLLMSVLDFIRWRL